METILEENIKDYQKIAYSVSNRFKSNAKYKGIEPDDLDSESMIGLIKAIRKFDPTYGVKFSTYAFNVIENQLKELLRNTNSGAKYSRRAKELLSKLDGTETIEEVIEKYQVKRSLVEEAFAFKNKGVNVSMDKTLNDREESNAVIGDFMGYKEDYTVAYVNEFLNTLPPKLKTIVEMTVMERPQKEIAKRVGYSQVYVSRQLKKVPELYYEFAREEI